MVAHSLEHAPPFLVAGGSFQGHAQVVAGWQVAPGACEGAPAGLTAAGGWAKAVGALALWDPSIVAVIMLVTGLNGVFAQRDGISGCRVIQGWVQ